LRKIGEREEESLPATIVFTLGYTLCDGHWYLDAVLGRDLRAASFT
jgi:hypothetical protein